MNDTPDNPSVVEISPDVRQTVDDIMNEVLANGWDWSTEQCMARAILAERERIASELDHEASVTPCEEDKMVTLSNAALVRANFSYEDAEKLSEHSTPIIPK